MTRDVDTAYLAEQLKLIRQLRNLTQANVADLCGLATRTIGKLENGKHRPDQQTLRSLARGLGVEVSAFEKASPEEQARARREIEKTIRTRATVPLSVVARCRRHSLASMFSMVG
jgi:transcriptional regulator with XRE-family HTH domain